MTYFSNILILHWYKPHPVGWLLWPASLLFKHIVRLRRFCYKYNIFKTYTATVPVIMVGNICVGGTGKTPLVIHLAQQLQQLGFKPGIVTRGYKGSITSATLVTTDMDPKLVGDEALLLAQRCNCPVVVAKQRVLGVKMLEKQYLVDMIISDDGLQHYALGRNIEIALVDQMQRFGNGYSLPMGPLRELPSRLNTVDLVLINGENMHLVCDNVYELSNSQHKVSLDYFKGLTVHAVAGIGNPERFFTQLRSAGINVIAHAFADHHQYNAADLTFYDNLPILMTEKDAVKCRSFAKQQCWVVAVNVLLEDNVSNVIEKLIQEL